MVKKVLLPICAAVLLAMLNWGCHREPVKPTEEGLNGEITSEPIIVNGVEAGYSLSYRSWIIPGEGDGSKLGENAPKGSSHDTVSVILHDTFYNIDTCAYVNDWEPSKYATYTCHWDRYGLPRPGENNVTITDSIMVLRIQFEEFSFNYRISFETANYDNGSIHIPMPYHGPVVIDLGAQELESMETVAKNGSVYARKLLRHSIKVVVGSTSYVLNAIDTLYRPLPNANPSRFVVRSEIVSETIPTALESNYSASSATTKVRYPYKCRFKQYYSDGTIDECEVDLSTNNHRIAWVEHMGVFADNDNAHCDNIMSLYDYSSHQLVPIVTDQETIGDYLTLVNNQYTLTAYFSGEGLSGPYQNSTILNNYSYVYDDGYTFYQKSFNVNCAYSRKEKECLDAENEVRLKMFFNYMIENLQCECYTTYIFVNHL